MGWDRFTGGKWPKGHTALTYMRDCVLTWRNEEAGVECSVVAIGRVRNTIYAAQRRTERHGDDTPHSYVRAVVVLLEGAGWKIMGEEMGPYECDCPKHVFDALSPLSEGTTLNSDAASWRERVAAAASAIRSERGVK